MAADEKERIEEILERASGLPQSQRLKYVNEACGADRELSDEIASLLAADGENSFGDFLDKGLPEIMKSFARRGDESRSDAEAQQLKHEEAEEKDRWEGKFVGDNARYEIVRLHRFGLMASLFFGKDTRVTKDVVIKIPRLSAYLKCDEDDDELQDSKTNIRNNFKREFDSLVQLAGCHYVVKVLDLGELSDGRPFMVQEFFDGRNALELLAVNTGGGSAATGLSFRQVANIVRQAGYGLAAAHELGILHRDMKAENIMVSHDGAVVKLIDFNAADVKLPISPMSTVFKHQTWGTLGYVSPEQLRNMLETAGGQPPVQLTSASDVYSLAVTAYQLLMGKLPFSTNLADLIKQQAACSYQPACARRAGLRKDVDELLRHALDYDPSKRPQSAKEFGETLANALERIDVAPTQTPRPDEMPAPQPRSTVWKIVLAAAVVLLLLGAGYMFRLASNNNRPSNSNTAVAAAPKPSLEAPEGTPPQLAKPLRTFSYWMEVTRVDENGRPVDRSPIRSSGQEVFANGDWFVLNFASPQNGHLYLLNEGKNYRDATTFYYQGKFSIKGGEPTSSQPLAFDIKDGTEKFWFLFSASPVEVLDEYQAPRELPEDRTEQIRSYLHRNVPRDMSAVEDESNIQMLVKGSGETIAYAAPLRHRKRLKE